VPGCSRTMCRQMRERWDSTAFHLFLGILPSGLLLSTRPSNTRFLVISAKETDGCILDLFADGPGRSLLFCPFHLFYPLRRGSGNIASGMRAQSLGGSPPFWYLMAPAGGPSTLAVTTAALGAGVSVHYSVFDFPHQLTHS